MFVRTKMSLIEADFQNRAPGVSRQPAHASRLSAPWHPESQDLTLSLLPHQLKVQIQQQGQEVPVGVDGSLLDQLLQSPLEREVAVDHEVGQHQRGGAAHSHDAVHQNSPWRADRMKGAEGGLARGLRLIHIIHGCSSHTVAFFFSIPLWAKNSFHISLPLFI